MSLRRSIRCQVGSEIEPFHTPPSATRNCGLQAASSSTFDMIVSPCLASACSRGPADKYSTTSTEELSFNEATMISRAIKGSDSDRSITIQCAHAVHRYSTEFLYPVALATTASLSLFELGRPPF